MTPDLLDTAAAAEYLGLKAKTVRRYLSVGTFAEPDARYGQSPVWHRTTLDQWKASRPGRTGRPKKETQR